MYTKNGTESHRNADKHQYIVQNTPTTIKHMSFSIDPKLLEINISQHVYVQSNQPFYVDLYDIIYICNFYIFVYFIYVEGHTT